MFKKLAVAAATCLIAIPALAIDNTGATAVIRLAAQVQTPSSVSESMPEMTGGQDHPTMGKKPATPSKKPTKPVPGPSSVSESMPEMTGGQDHPTMGKKPATK